MPKATPEDLVNTVIAADDLRRKARGLPSTRAAKYLASLADRWAALALGRKDPPPERTFIEPFFNVLGFLWGQGMRMLPSRLRRRFVQRVNCKMGGYSPTENPELPLRIEETVRLARDIKQQTGQWPALFILTSHPETEGPRHWLRFELLRQGLQIADAVVEARKPGAWYPAHPECFLAIDPFALDTVSVPVGAFYGAWVHRIYLAWDRQPSTQSWIQKHFLLRNTGYDRIAWRLLRTLKADVPVLMVLSGGLPYNARLLYAAREFVQRLPVDHWKVSKRKAQKELMEILMTPEGSVWPADDGVIPLGKQRQITDALAAWGLPEEKSGPCLRELVEEFKLPVPHRARLFRVLRSRLVEKGKALIVVRIDHSEAPPYVWISDPRFI
jgi:hypothetical protein